MHEIDSVHGNGRLLNRKGAIDFIKEDFKLKQTPKGIKVLDRRNIDQSYFPFCEKS